MNYLYKFRHQLLQVRKLEFLMAKALQEGCDTILACGSTQSNCARACAVAARQLGLLSHLILGMDGGVVCYTDFKCFFLL